MSNNFIILWSDYADIIDYIFSNLCVIDFEKWVKLKQKVNFPIFKWYKLTREHLQL